MLTIYTPEGTVLPTFHVRSTLPLSLQLSHAMIRLPLTSLMKTSVWALRSTLARIFCCDWNGDG